VSEDGPSTRRAAIRAYKGLHGPQLQKVYEASKELFLPQSGQMMTVTPAADERCALPSILGRPIALDFARMMSICVKDHGSVHLGAVPSISLWLPKVTFAILPCFATLRSHSPQLYPGCPTW